MTSYCFGIDIGGTTVKCGLFQTNGELCEKWEIVTRTEENGKEILPDVAKAILGKMAEKQIGKDQVSGVGIGVPGPVIREREVAVAVNLHWGYTMLADELESLLGGIPVKVGNDANVAALGEMWKGGGEGTKNLIMATLGTGVGGGIIVDGKIITGSHGAGGEIGHACVDPAETESCNCGNKGCLEQMASATGIVRLGNKILSESQENTVLEKDTLSAKTIFDAYKEGDAVAAKIVDKFAGYLGNALAIFACVVDPEVIVIGGGVSKAGQPLIDAIEKYFRRDAFVTCKDTPIVLAKLDNDAGIFGAAKLVVED
ncbi:MAG: ROK family glucokinase [Oliverpabstia sp.]|nr:ROK family glucokinase [Lachnospiraceae bacterium]MDY5025738.1 ROK family glucokinase [Oliverpabstia sp.]